MSKELAACSVLGCALPLGHWTNHRSFTYTQGMNPRELHVFAGTPGKGSVCLHCGCLFDHFVHNLENPTAAGIAAGAFMAGHIVPDPGTQQHFASGASSTKMPRLGLIWFEALRRIAIRCELSIQIRGVEKSCNALGGPQGSYTEIPFLIARMENAIAHTYRIIEKLRDGRDLDETDDDPAALAWAGAFICEASLRLRQQHEKRARDEQLAQDAQAALGTSGQSS